MYYLGPIGNPDPVDFINLETQRLPFKNSQMWLSDQTGRVALDHGPIKLKVRGTGTAAYRLLREFSGMNAALINALLFL